MSDRIEAFHDEVVGTLTNPALTIEDRLWRVDSIMERSSPAMKSIAEDAIDSALKAGDLVDIDMDYVPESGEDTPRKKKLRRALEQVRGRNQALYGGSLPGGSAPAATKAGAVAAPPEEEEEEETERQAPPFKKKKKKKKGVANPKMKAARDLMKRRGKAAPDSEIKKERDSGKG